MNTFPYESWDDALAAAAEGDASYFTFGPGGSTALIIITILAIVLMAGFMMWLANHEGHKLDDAARALQNKYAEAG